MTRLKQKMTLTSGRQLALINDGFAALFNALMSQILYVHIDNYSIIIIFLCQDLYCIWFTALSSSDPGRYTQNLAY